MANSGQSEMAMNELQRATFKNRMLEGMREVGVLLIAFAPLDSAMPGQVNLWMLAGFLVMGACLFSASILLELRAQR
jgi:hypothetical protein